jgi:hypothetical protein
MYSSEFIAAQRALRTPYNLLCEQIATNGKRHAGIMKQFDWFLDIAEQRLGETEAATILEEKEAAIVEFKALQAPLKDQANELWRQMKELKKAPVEKLWSESE